MTKIMPLHIISNIFDDWSAFEARNATDRLRLN